MVLDEEPDRNVPGPDRPVPEVLSQHSQAAAAFERPPAGREPMSFYAQLTTVEPFVCAAFVPVRHAADRLAGGCGAGERCFGGTGRFRSAETTTSADVFQAGQASGRSAAA